MSKYNQFGEETIKCKICGQDTAILGTGLCDRCWELERRIEADPELAEKILGMLHRKQPFTRLIIETRKLPASAPVRIEVDYKNGYNLSCCTLGQLREALTAERNIPDSQAESEDLQ